MNGKSEIVDFFADKSVFITGGTGFMGKVLVEKLLRSCTEVKQIYLLIRSKKGTDANTRIQETLKSTIFDKFRENGSKALNKVIAIEGDISLPGLDMSEENLKELIENVSVVFHSAANTRFNEPLKTVINYNVLGTKRVVELCYKLPKLLALIHVSSAFSNCNRLEIDEIVYPSKDSAQVVIDMSESTEGNELEQKSAQVLKGFPNTYNYSKGLTERCLLEECPGLPIAIMRPSIVVASWSEPIPGWIDNLGNVSAIMKSAGEGSLREGHMNTKAQLDIVPVDTAINLMIALVWFTATKHLIGVQVYNCTSGMINPVTYGKFVEKLNPPHSTKYPGLNMFRYPGFSNSSTEWGYKLSLLVKETIPAFLLDTMIAMTGRDRFLTKHTQKINRIFGYYWWFSVKDYQFYNKNLFKVHNLLNETDKKIFNFDIRKLDWDKYFENFWFGIKLFILKEGIQTLNEARTNMRKIYYRDKAIICLFIITIFLLIYFIYLIILYLVFAFYKE